MPITSILVGDETQIHDEVARVSRFPDHWLIVDLGGGMQRLARANYVVDLVGYDESRKYSSRGSPDRCPRENWVQADLCDPLIYHLMDWHDDIFHYSFCSQTIEDVRDPIGLVREMSRVSRSGFISTIHWTYELNAQISTYFGAPRDDFVGYWHHRWAVGIKDGVLEFICKHPFVHYELDYKVPEAGQMLHVSWEGDIQAQEVIYPGPPKRRDFMDFIQSRWGLR